MTSGPSNATHGVGGMEYRNESSASLPVLVVACIKNLDRYVLFRQVNISRSGIELATPIMSQCDHAPVRYRPAEGMFDHKIMQVFILGFMTRLR